MEILLIAFKEHLKVHFSDTCTRKAVDNIARFLHFVDPNEISLTFLHDAHTLKRFVSTMIDLKFANATIKNFLGQIQVFVKFLTSRYFKDTLGEERCNAALSFLDAVKQTKEGLNKTSSKQPVKRKLSVMESQKVLSAAKLDVVNMLSHSNQGDLSDSEKTITCYYLEAILILKHLFGPTVVQNLQVKNWLAKTSVKYSDGGSSIKVYIMTTGGTRIVLTEEEELMFNYYFKNVRPTQLQKDGKMVKAFFLSCKGNPVANPSNDINRLQKKYNLLPVTGKDAKQAFN
ncbi:uncharacterized protein [Engystomops pustulosus]|uniref:uncharacterized protein n=1 Tax=Engystomops pustulosus TaxID=76066 RepID=UPI003AFAE9C2